jgi:hypothetical protein
MVRQSDTIRTTVLEPATLEFRASEPVVEHLQAVPPPLPSPIPLPIPIPFPRFLGSRVMIWKQDPSVAELGRRLAYVPELILNGPQNARIDTIHPGTTPVVRNTNGDFIFPTISAEADCVHTFTVAHQALRMWEQSRGGARIPWAWNTGGNADRLTCRPRGFSGANAFYSRLGKTLSFGFFLPQNSPNEVFTCRSLDIVAHEAGHAILDGLKPGWLGTGNVPQTGALHESFGDLTAIFVALSQFDQVDAFIAMSKANLHDKNFLSAVAEEFGAALVPPRPSGLRDADNDLKLSQVGNQVHSLSQVFTGAIYDILSDIFVHERIRQSAVKDPTQILFEVARHLRGLLLEAIVAAPASGATFAHVANAMMKRSKAKGDPPIYRTFIRNRFTVREVVVSPLSLAAITSQIGTMDYADAAFTGDGAEEAAELHATEHISCLRGAPQDRSHCCGTMQLPEYARSEEVRRSELKELARGAVLTDETLLAEEYEELHQAFT